MHIFIYKFQIIVELRILIASGAAGGSAKGRIGVQTHYNSFQIFLR